MRQAPLIALLAALLLAGCSNQPDSGDPPIAAVPTDTDPATTTTLATTTTTPAARLGSTQTYTSTDGESQGDITVFRYRANAVRPEYRNDKDVGRYAAVEVRVCVRKAPDGAASLSWEPWSLTDAQDQTYGSADNWSDDQLVSPLYPQYLATRAGQCRRGWVPFQLPDEAKPTTVEYNTGEGDILTWPIGG